MLKRKITKTNKKDRKSQLIIVGSLLILVGIGIIGGKYLYNYIQDKREEDLIESFYEEQTDVAENIDTDTTEEVVKPVQQTEKKVDYIAVIKIPKINLEKGLCEKGSYCNNVNKNIQILDESSYPDKEQGNVILAGHSGNGRTAYFKNLYKLNQDDEISIFYNNSEYKYKVVNMYDIDKTGSANIVRNLNKSTLTLITCRHNTNKQIIVICELVEKI